MPPRESNKVSAGRAKVKATAKSNPVASTASRASVGARATRASSPRTTSVSKPVAPKTDFALGPGGQVKFPTVKSPVQGGQVTQKVGVANPRQGYQSGRNEGLDLAAAAGTPVIAGADYGTVIGVNPNAGAYGNQIIIQYPHGVTAAYNHLDSFGNIKKGQKVGANDVIGNLGSTGNTTGPHLDWEITKNGVSVDAATAFTGYQFEGFNGGEKGVSDKGFNRSNNKFYSLNDLSESPGGSVYASGSGAGSGSSSFSTGSSGSVNASAKPSSGLSGGQFVNLASLATPGVNRGMKRFSSRVTPFSSPKPFKSSASSKMTNFSKDSVGSFPSASPTSKIT
jgi:murein DD-endopeptidase MepM/ murein hydrolase activator NlpD